MIERIGDNRVVGGQERLEYAAVGVEAGGVEDCVLGLEEVRYGFLQPLVDVLGAADEADGAHSVAPLLHRRLRGLDEPRVVGQAEVVVGAEVQRLRPVLQRDLRALRGCYVPFILIQTRFPYCGELIGEMFLKFSVHDVLVKSSVSNIVNNYYFS